MFFPMLQLSSCLFGTVTLHAYWARNALHVVACVGLHLYLFYG